MSDIEICPTCGGSYDTDTGCPKCSGAYRFTRRLLQWQKRFAETVRAVRRLRLAAAR